MIAVIIGLVLLGVMLAVPFSFFAFTRITKAKKEAKAILEKGKIDDIKKVEGKKTPKRVSFAGI